MNPPRPTSLAEAAVLSAIMLDMPALDRVLEFMEPTDFTSEANQHIFDAAKELRSLGHAVDVVQIGTLLKRREKLADAGGMKYLTEVIDTAPEVTDVLALARAISLRTLFTNGARTVEWHIEGHVPTKATHEETIALSLPELVRRTRADLEKIMGGEA